jgi:predicted unusual protein kinase regulating ubiquinone biosynthesis (AarF/ABC1/UbiB family)
VKVQYPGVEAAIRADLANTELLGTFLQLLVSAVPSLTKMDVRGMAREISERIGEEIDYLTEAANQREFADAYHGHPFIRIPEVHDELSTGRVLTMQFVEGMRYAEAKLADQPLRDQWGEAIFRFVYGSLWKLGLNNADPHPGNYLFHPDGTVTFLDFGCVKRLARPLVEDLMEGFRSTLAKDAEALLRLMIRSGYFKADAGIDRGELLALTTETYSYMTQPQPFTFTPEFIANTWRVALSGPHKRLTRKMAQPVENTMLLRVGTGSMSVLGGLRATGYWKAVLEQNWGEAPCTPYGELDAEFWAARCAAADRGGC